HLAVIIQQQMFDPRFASVNITQVQVTPDLSEAKVYFTALFDEDTQDQGKALCLLLNKAQKHLRYTLAQEVDLRRTPKLHFYYDTKLIEAMRISALLSKTGDD
ncbi:MAG TPA: 30S ribosome-binding factor RbfA, partial [Gammaproteobacteria bacterium]|nr:30S ribosome-binding factor RbfA [Gammaproteobacteria bacterium]